MKRICKCCGKEFQAKPSVVKRGYGNFCCRSCASKYKWLGNKNPNWKEPIKLVCEYCGKEFTRKPWELKGHHKGRFCSADCKNKFQDINYHVEGNPSWLGGKNRRWAWKLGKKYNMTRCAICGTTKNIHIHHKDGNQRNNKLRNLIPLCAKHHKEAHKND